MLSRGKLLARALALPLAAFTVVCSPLISRSAHAQFVFQKIADTKTVMPGNAPNLFSAFRTASDEQTLSFYGGSLVTFGSGGGRQGMYRATGIGVVSPPPLSLIVDTTTTFPGDAPNTFNVVRTPNLGGGGTTFFGQSTSFPAARTSIFADFGGGFRPSRRSGRPFPGEP
jgi:hypothetical protein